MEDDLDSVANELYVVLVQPDTIWWDDLTPEIKEAYRRLARHLKKGATSFGRNRHPYTCASCTEEFTRKSDYEGHFNRLTLPAQHPRQP